ncbi:MAG: hypothetical protein NC389_17185 [Acetatifactor muris]|nr:hypothetical protein [Acetatifactor muris]
MREVIEKRSYQEFRQELQGELNRAAEGFVKIGYLLKVARDTDILKESGYSSVVEFAKEEYGIDKTQVSRFIHINDRFSEGGYGERLEQQYQGFGYAKLTLMLQLPDAVNEELTADYSKAEIQAIKDEADEEKKVTDLEIMMENVPEPIRDSDILSKAVFTLGEAEPELYVSIHVQMSEEGWCMERLKDSLAPDGEHSYSIRIPGAGRHVLIIGERITMTNLRSGEKAAYSWEQVGEAWRELLNLEISAEEDWASRYGRPFPRQEKKEVAPVQQKKSKVTKARAPEKKKMNVTKARAPEKSEKKGTEAKTAEKEPEETQQAESEAGQQSEAGQKPEAGKPSEAGQKPEAGKPSEAGQQSEETVSEHSTEEANEELKGQIIETMKWLHEQMGENIKHGLWELVAHKAVLIRAKAGTLMEMEADSEKTDKGEGV